MSRKHKNAGPIPKGNRTQFGPHRPVEDETQQEQAGAPPSEQDPKRRLGELAGAGEHAIEQPGGKQGPNR